MVTIKNNVTNELVIKHSKFITKLIKLDNDVSVKEHLNILRTSCPDANHYCYAYIDGEKKQSSDDGEPTGTAGIIILNVLEQHQLDHVLCVVIRYFGGIKLGARGLIRAYTKATTTALIQSQFIPLIKGYQCQITYQYTVELEMKQLLKHTIVIDNIYQETIITIFKISIEDYLKQKEELEYRSISFQVEKEVEIEQTEPANDI